MARQGPICIVRGKIVGREKLRMACDNAGFLVQLT